jgi:hypothetical protein
VGSVGSRAGPPRLRGPMRAIREWGTAIAAILGLVAGGLALFVQRTAGAQDAPIIERVVKLEAKQEENDRRWDELNRRLERIEAKLDRALGIK